MGKQITKFMFYELYWSLIKNESEQTVGRFIKRICQYMFTGNKLPTLKDKKEAFIWSNIEDFLIRSKEAEKNGKSLKTLNQQMRHFAFLETYYRAIDLMEEEQSGAYLKALCKYMFDGILFVRSNGNKALVGRTMIVSNIENPTTFSGFCIRFRPNTDKVDPLYMLYLFKSPIFRRYFSNNQQTSITNLNQDVLGSILIDLPTLYTQKTIVKVIHSLTRRIENNNQVNDNLANHSAMVA